MGTVMIFVLPLQKKLFGGMLVLRFDATLLTLVRILVTLSFLAVPTYVPRFQIGAKNFLDRCDRIFCDYNFTQWCIPTGLFSSTDFTSNFKCHELRT